MREGGREGGSGKRGGRREGRKRGRHFCLLTHLELQKQTLELVRNALIGLLSCLVLFNLLIFWVLCFLWLKPPPGGKKKEGGGGEGGGGEGGGGWGEKDEEEQSNIACMQINMSPTLLSQVLYTSGVHVHVHYC